MKSLFSLSSTKRYVLFCIFFLFLFTYIFQEFTNELIEQELYHFDQTIIAWIYTFQPHLNEIMLFFTFFGSFEALFLFLLLACACLIWRHKRWEALFLVVGIAGGGFFNFVLKLLFRRERPDFFRLIEEYGYSFPSGHSMGAFIFYGLLCMILISFIHSSKTKWTLLASTAFLIIMVGLSRIYLGVHYPSDVIAGYAAGGAWVCICLIGLKLAVQINKRKTYFTDNAT